MPAYMIVQMQISDPERFRQYRDAVLPLIKKFEGKQIVRRDFEVLEGQDDGRRLAIFEFPTTEAVHAFWNSPEYKPVKAIRDGAAQLDVWCAPST